MGKLSEEHTRRFMKLFSGLSRAYGTYDMSNAVADERGKRKGKAETIREDVIPEHYSKHLIGADDGDGLGIIPIQDGDVVSFASIDIDEYSKSSLPEDERKEKEAELVAKLLDIIKTNKLPLVPTRSKSGGVHLHVFLKAPVPAKLVKKKLEEWARQLGFPSAEVFPKQATIKENAVGNWINLPWFKAEDTVRYAWNVETGEAIRDFDAWLDYAESKRTDAKKLTGREIKLKDVTADASSIMEGGPPCLQKTLAESVPEGGRNEVAYNIAIRLIKEHGRDEDVVSQELMRIEQQHFDPPLEDQEHNQVVASAIKAEKIHYRCSVMPNCNRTMCMGMTYGIGTVTFSFGSLYHLVPESARAERLWDESSYQLEVTLNGVEHLLEIETGELLKYPAIKQKALSRGVLLPHIDAEDWSDDISKKMEDLNTVIVREELTVLGQLRSLLQEYLPTACKAKERRLITERRGFFDEEKGEYILRPAAVPNYLKKQRFQAGRGQNIRRLLIDHFDLNTETKVGVGADHKSVRMWIFPHDSIFLPDKKDAEPTE